MRTKNIILILISLLFISDYATADLTNDTLRLRSMPKDTAKCNLLIQSSEKLRDFNSQIGLRFGLEAIDLATSLKYLEGIAAANRAVGLNYWRMGVYDAALNHFFIALDIYSDFKDDYHIGKLFNNIGLIFFARTQYDKALEYLNNGLTIAKKLNKPSEISRILHNIGLIEFENRNLNKSLSLHLESLKYSLIAQDTMLQAFNYCFIGRSYAHLNKYDLAKSNLEKGLDFFKAINNPNNIAMTYNQIADFYILKKDYQEAINIAQKAFAIGEQVGNKYMKMEASKFLYKAYQGLNDYKKAFEYSRLAGELSDTMKNETNIREIEQKVAFYEFQKKLKEIESEKEHEIYRNKIMAQVAFAIASLLFIVAIVSFAFYRLKSKTSNLLMAKNKEISQLNSELEQLNFEKDKFMSIIAHDLKNPIGNFKLTTSMLVQYYDSLTDDDFKDMLLLLNDSSENVSQLLENLLQWSRSKRGNIEYNPTEIVLSDVANLCVQLLNPSALSKSITIDNQIVGNEIAFADANMTATIFRNLISNAIKFTPVSGNIIIGVDDISLDNNFYNIFIKDSGIGLSQDNINKLFDISTNSTTPGTAGEKGTGLGLILCKEFVEKHGGRIWVDSRSGEGSTFYFSLPKFIKE